MEPASNTARRGIRQLGISWLLCDLHGTPSRVHTKLGVSQSPCPLEDFPEPFLFENHVRDK